MFPLNYALAAVLLSTPAEPTDPCDAMDCLVTTRPALRSLSLYWEILDPREADRILTRAEDFPSDLKLLRHRYRDLADAPPLYDCMRFPQRTLIDNMLTFNRAYRQHLENRQALEPANAWELHEMRLEADQLYQIWDLARDTRCDYFYVAVRRQALKKLKELIGDQAFSAVACRRMCRSGNSLVSTDVD